MQMLTDLFYIVLYVSVIGSIFTAVLLFISRILQCALPLWFPLGGMILYAFPFLSPDVFLIPRETQMWAEGFRAASVIWVCGCILFLIRDWIRLVLAGQAVKNCRICRDRRLAEISIRCAGMAGLKRKPLLYWGSLDDPVCVTGILRPVILLKEEITAQLSDAELTAVLSHEMTHVRRKHILLERIWAYICILNWFNPLVWAAAKEFSLHCEMDCDDKTLRNLRGKITKAEYAYAMIRLLELSAVRKVKHRQGTGALSFFLTKRRVRRMTAESSKRKKRMTAVLLIVVLAFVIIFSMRFSRQHFYPYPAYNVGIETGVQ